MAKDSVKSLKTLIKLYTAKLDEKKRILADLQTLLMRMQQDLAQLQHELSHEQKVAQESPMLIGAYPAYAKANQMRQDEVLLSMHKMKRDIEWARMEVQAAHQEHQKFEKAKELRMAEIQAELNYKEDLFIDELALTQFRKFQDNELE